MKTKVMIVDDQFIARKLFELYLTESEQYEVSCLVESAADAAGYLQQYPSDLILMDILMNDASNGIAEAATIKKNNPSVKIIAITSMPEESWLKRAKKAGIDSFWYKESSKETILHVMDRTMAGESVYPDHPPVVALGHACSTDFTERELEVLRVMTKGASNQEIAQELCIAENTVKQHIRHMMEKSGCKSRTELAIEARISGVVIPLE